MKYEIKICKYCGVEFRSHHGRVACGGCNYKSALLPRFVWARDELRRLTGLPPMGNNLERMRDDG